MTTGSVAGTVFKVGEAAAVAVVALWLRKRFAGSRGVYPDGSGGWRVLRGPILVRYRAEGGPVGGLGRPISNEEPAARGPARPLGADREVRFERGVIWLESRGGSTKIQYDNQMPGSCGAATAGPLRDPTHG